MTHSHDDTTINIVLRLRIIIYFILFFWPISTTCRLEDIEKVVTVNSVERYYYYCYYYYCHLTDEICDCQNLSIIWNNF